MQFCPPDIPGCARGVGCVRGHKGRGRRRGNVSSKTSAEAWAAEIIPTALSGAAQHLAGEVLIPETARWIPVMVMGLQYIVRWWAVTACQLVDNTEPVQVRDPDGTETRSVWFAMAAASGVWGC